MFGGLSQLPLLQLGKMIVTLPKDLRPAVLLWSRPWDIFTLLLLTKWLLPPCSWSMVWRAVYALFEDMTIFAVLEISYYCNMNMTMYCYWLLIKTCWESTATYLLAKNALHMYQVLSYKLNMTVEQSKIEIGTQEDGGVSKLAPIRACKFTREVVKLFMSALHQTKLILQW